MRLFQENPHSPCKGNHLWIETKKSDKSHFGYKGHLSQHKKKDLYRSFKKRSPSVMSVIFRSKCSKSWYGFAVQHLKCRDLFRGASEWMNVKGNKRAA